MSAGNTNPTFEPWRYLNQVKAVYLAGSSKEPVDVSENFVSAEVFEDIFSDSVSGNIILKDTKNIIKDLKLNGADRLLIVVGDEVKGDVPLEFFVYSHSYTALNDTSELVTLDFVTMPFILSQNSRLWGAYKGSIHSIVSSVFNGVLSNYKTSSIDNYTPETFELEVDNCEGVIKIVSPGWTPFEMLGWLSGRATDVETSGSLFLFYQTIFDGYKFKCVEKLVKEGNTKEIDNSHVFYYGYKGSGFERNNIHTLSIGDLGDTLETTYEQFTDLWQIDLTKKKITKRTYNAETASKPLLNERIIGQLNSENAFDFNFPALHKKGNLKALIKNESALVHNGIDFYTGNSFQRKFGMLKQIQAMSVSFECFSNNQVQVGDVVEIIVPQKRGVDNKDTLKTMLDNEVSGRYLIAAKSIKYDLHEVKMQIQAIKDSALE